MVPWRNMAHFVRASGEDTRTKVVVVVVVVVVSLLSEVTG